MTAAVPTMVRFVRQSGHHGDCGITTLAMLAGVMYEDALAAVIGLEPTVLQTGLRWTEMRRAARKLGLKTRLLRSYDLEEATGVLALKDTTKRGEDHYVFLWEGRIIDGNGELWREPSDFFKHYSLRPMWLLVAVD
jgi:ABC-type bacteriocin/lantibiotic exporter with double-glycine peptidase domain